MTFTNSTVRIAARASVCLISLGCATLKLQLPGSDELIVNGSFEEPVVARGSFQLFAPGSTFPGWRVIGAPGNVAPISGEYRAGQTVFNASHGAQWLDLTGLSNTATGVEQAVTTNPGTSYELIFDLGNVVAPSYGNASSVEVLVDGRSLGIARNNSGAGTNRQAWMSFSVSFKAAGRTTTVAFLNRDDRSDNSNGLDHVTLRPGGNGSRSLTRIARRD